MPDAKWGDFCGLLDIDGNLDSGLGEAARTLKNAMAKYMTMRFGSADIRYLVDIVNAAPVIAAVVQTLTNITNDDIAIKAAVAVVTTPVGP
jgi:hypothetical protein